MGSVAAICQVVLLSLIALAEANTDSFIPVLITNVNSQVTHHDTQYKSIYPLSTHPSSEWLEGVKEARSLKEA